MNVFRSNCTAYAYGLYAQAACLLVWLILLVYVKVLVSITIYICACLQLYAGGGNTKFLSLHLLPFTKDILSAKALMLSTAGINDVF